MDKTNNSWTCKNKQTKKTLWNTTKTMPVLLKLQLFMTHVAFKTIVEEEEEEERNDINSRKFSK